MTRLFSILNKFSRSLNRFLNDFDVSATQILRRLIIWYSLHDCSHFRNNNFLNALLSSMFALSIVSCCFKHSLSNHVRLRSSNVVSTKGRRRSRVVVSFRLILSQCVFVSVLCAFLCNLIRVLTWRKIRCSSIDWICASTSRIWCEVVLKTSQIIRSLILCSSMISFVSLFDVSEKVRFDFEFINKSHMLK